MGKYRKRPVVVEAVQWLGNNLVAVDNFIVDTKERRHRTLPAEGRVEIDALEGTMVANIGDWVIKGVAGEYYPCKDSIFQEAYEEVTIGGNNED